LCIGSRPHRLTYNIDGGATLDSIRNAGVHLRPAKESEAANGLCSSGSKSFCIGANVDSTCTEAAKSIPLRAPFDCHECFVGLSTDVLYSLNVSEFRLEAVEFGLKDSHLRAEAEVRASASAAKTVSGGITLVSNRTASISFTVANLIPVNIEVAMPTSLDYWLGVSGAIEAVAGAKLDLTLGDHFVKYTHGQGFHRVSTEPHVNVTPVLKHSAGLPSAGLRLELKTGINVTIDKVLTYFMHMNSILPVEVYPEKSDSEVCARGDVTFPVDHGADLHFTLLGKNYEIAQFGPEELFRYHKALSKCENLTAPAAAAQELIV
jgi:hypothetical protein